MVVLDDMRSMVFCSASFCSLSAPVAFVAVERAHEDVLDVDVLEVDVEVVEEEHELDDVDAVELETRLCTDEHEFDGVDMKFMLISFLAVKFSSLFSSCVEIPSNLSRVLTAARVLLLPLIGGTCARRFMPISGVREEYLCAVPLILPMRSMSRLRRLALFS